MLRCAVSGSQTYYVWLAFLSVFIVCGAIAYSVQLRSGLGVTNMSQQVSWGAYIANFTFLVGIAAAAVLLVVPTYVYHRKDIKEVVLIAELMAATAIIMCLLFVTVDLGRPERFWHLMPFIGRLNLPSSMLAWDVVVLTGYLLLNLHVPGYLLYMLYLGKTPSKKMYMPLVFVSIFWAISIHTVTAFLYGGFGGRPVWNTAILAPRFLVSAFASGPALLILVFAAINKFTNAEVRESIFLFLRRVIVFALPLNFFLFGSEVFTEFYTGSTHSASVEYMFFGLHGHSMIAPYIWAAMIMGLTAIVIFAVPRLYKDNRILYVGSALCVTGVWIEKGMGMVVPGFIPTPTGDLVEYTPSSTEFLICLGIWALGAFIFTVLCKVALAIQSGDLRENSSS
jgi:molybdopterin-containing oxidoreductase family membrane subunit